MKRNQLAALVLAGSTMLWACGNNDKKDGGSMTTGENTMVDSSTTTPAAGTAVTLDTMDQNFAMKAASSDMLEIQAANMAMQNGSHDRVKSYATMMIRDHGQTSTQLKTLASGKGITLPTDMMPEHRTQLEKLNGKTGKAFDKAYADLNVASHREAVNLFEKASNGAKDADIKGFAAQHLPHLRMHLDSAQAISNAKM